MTGSSFALNLNGVLQFHLSRVARDEQLTADVTKHQPIGGEFQSVQIAPAARDPANCNRTCWHVTGKGQGRDGRDLARCPTSFFQPSCAMPVTMSASAPMISIQSQNCFRQPRLFYAAAAAIGAPPRRGTSSSLGLVASSRTVPVQLHKRTNERNSWIHGPWLADATSFPPDLRHPHR